jgi:hypothetical protein
MGTSTYEFSHSEVFREIRRMGTKGKYSPAYIGRVRSGYDRSENLAALIAKAEARLKAKAAADQAKAPASESVR